MIIDEIMMIDHFNADVHQDCKECLARMYLGILQYILALGESQANYMCLALLLLFGVIDSSDFHSKSEHSE